MENKYDPYCPVCSGCGEDGCCPATICQQSPDGHYCESYLNDLKFGYKMWMWIEENITFQHEDKDIINKAWDRIYDEVYKVKQESNDNILEGPTGTNGPDDSTLNETEFFNNQKLLEPEYYEAMNELLKSKIGNKPTKDRNYDQ